MKKKLQQKKLQQKKHQKTAAVAVVQEVQHERSLSEILASLPPEKKELIKRTVAKDATDDELELFFHVCARNNTHPLDRLIVFTKFRDGDSEEGEKKVVLISTIDFFRSRSFAYGKLAGIDPPVFEGEITEVNGRKVPAYCRVTGYQMVGGQRVAYHGEARWTEFCPSGKRKAIWLRQPYNMLAKCAEAQLHRKIAPTLLHNIYLREEMDIVTSKPEPVPQHGQQMVKALLEKAKQNQEEVVKAQPVHVGLDFWKSRLPLAKTERQVLAIKREAAKNLTEDEMKQMDEAVVARLSEIAPKEDKRGDYATEEHKAELAARLRDTIRKVVPNYLVKGHKLTLEEHAVVAQLLTEGFGTHDLQTIAKMPAGDIERGIMTIEELTKGKAQ